MLRFICFAIFSLFLMSTAVSSDIYGAAVVIDGDTVIVGETKVRLHGIDAPEMSQTCVVGGGRENACGTHAARVLRTITAGRIVSCIPKGRSYDRIVARCLVDGHDVGERMVSQGWAIAALGYGVDYSESQEYARANNFGLHQSHFMEPAAFRSYAPDTQTSKDCVLKGNISKNGRIYHAPGQNWYDRTKITPSRGERWFCSRAQAEAAGFRAARR
jgi:endonuclease YncB( thermonuclease family)